MNRLSRCFWVFLFMLPVASIAQEFTFTDKKKDLQILYSSQGPRLDSISAYLLANDIKLVTGREPVVITDISGAKGNVIVIGNISTPLIQEFIGKQSSLVSKLKDKWECYALKVIDKPDNNIAKAFVIAGSDTRGTAYGVFTLSEKLGVSPWYWWADVPVKQQKVLTIQQSEFIADTPGVKFRGIFINDEDWGLQPWAAKTFEPETGDIGPKTYAKVFELLLRLKANLIWPAMHPCTKAFFYYPENKKVAEDYSIVIGTSHAEPMLRNNVDEWDEKTMGHFNYITNKEKVYSYWENRIKESTAIDAIYTMGMRGVHDSGMEGVKSTKEAATLLEQIIKDQRNLLQKYQGKDVTAIPQAFTAYKEVLDIYDNGLKLPDDITLVWPDDNYGYIHRLNNEVEKKRGGGSGVYYHASYWGRPHDYLWLSSTHPALIAEEMLKAFNLGANKIWVLNVGDIKPLEYNMDLFLQLAYAPLSGTNTWDAKAHLQLWVGKIFGQKDAALIAGVLWEYYRLAFERKPEFTGWSRTEPTTQITNTEYNHFYYGDEAQKRIDLYEALERAVKTLRVKMEGDPAAAFYQLVYYPVMGASWMNKKFLYRDKAIFYAKQNRLSATDYAAMSKAVYDSIINETDYYNNLLSGGKWKNIMSMKPRDLPVFKAPVFAEPAIDAAGGWSIAPEGFVTKNSSLLGDADKMQLPVFDNINQQRYFVDVFLSETKTVNWKAVASHKWISVSRSSGTLRAEQGKNQERIWVTIDWSSAPVDKQLAGTIIFKGPGKQIEVTVLGNNLERPRQIKRYTLLEHAGGVVINAASYAEKGGDSTLFEWNKYDGLGYTGQVLCASLPKPDEKAPVFDAENIKKKNRFVEYDFYTFTSDTASVTVFSIPTHPVNNNFSNRYAVSVDDGAVTVVDFKTVGRSEEWKRNVLSNRAIRNIQLQFLEKGLHKLRIYCIDPGVMLDEIRIDLGGLKQAYSNLPESTHKGF